MALLKAPGEHEIALAVKRMKRREAQMPTVDKALLALFNAYQRLKELGFNDIMYCPKDGSVFEVVEIGSTGIHDCHYEGEWPDGSWWVHSAGDLWPSHPVLFRLKPHPTGSGEQE